MESSMIRSLLIPGFFTRQTEFGNVSQSQILLLNHVVTMPLFCGRVVLGIIVYSYSVEEGVKV